MASHPANIRFASGAPYFTMTSVPNSTGVSVTVAEETWVGAGSPNAVSESSYSGPGEPITSDVSDATYACLGNGVVYLD